MRKHQGASMGRAKNLKKQLFSHVFLVISEGFRMFVLFLSVVQIQLRTCSTGFESMGEGLPVVMAVKGLKNSLVPYAQVPFISS